MADREIIARLERIEELLCRLVVPIQQEEGRQLRSASNAQRKAHNKEVLQRARERQRRAA